MVHRHLALIIGTLLVVPTISSAQTTRTRDSAGVRITENPARLTFAVNLKLGDKPIFDVGGLDDDNPDAEFDPKNGSLRGIRLSDGGLVAIDVNRVKYFDATGKLVKVAGRNGDGPGEFRYLTSICRTRGDTIVVADRTRLGVLDKRGNFVRHIASTPRGLPLDGCFDDGTLILTQSKLRVPTPTTRTTALSRIRLDGTVVAALDDMVGSGFDMVTQVEITWAAAGSRLFVGDGGRHDIPVFQVPVAPSRGAAKAARMTQVASIRSADATSTITDGEIEQRLTMTIGNVSPATRKARMNDMKAMPRASTWPVIGRIHADPDGNLWVADYDRAWKGPIAYSKFDFNGRLVSRLVIPVVNVSGRRLVVISFGRNDVLVSRQDDDGAAHLSVYPIVPVR